MLERLVAITVFAMASCASTPPRPPSATHGSLRVADPCKIDSDCQTGVCRNAHDYDSACNGAICTGACKTNEDCIELAERAGSDHPFSSYCGDDQRCFIYARVGESHEQCA
jgi:hypothetical protein